MDFGERYKAVWDVQTAKRHLDEARAAVQQAQSDLIFVEKKYNDALRKWEQEFFAAPQKRKAG